MTTALQISCINKSNREAIHKKILFVGGIQNGSRWKYSLEDAIALIELRKVSFYVQINGRRADVIIALSAAQNKYLKTTADSDQLNNLLNLPECP